jgi:hypothetical protein
MGEGLIRNRRSAAHLKTEIHPIFTPQQLHPFQQTMAPVVITGVLPPSGSAAPPAPSPRLEINDFIKNKKYFSLYVQALRM